MSLSLFILNSFIKLVVKNYKRHYYFIIIIIIFILLNIYFMIPFTLIVLFRVRWIIIVNN
jgi:hypothetical protein